MALPLDSTAQEPASTPRAVRGEFSDLDQITEWIPDFDSEYVQLGRGRVASSLIRVALDHLTLIRFDEDMPSYAFRATAPSNALTLVFAAAPAADAAWRGAPVTDRTLLLYGAGAEHVGRSQGRLTSVSVHVAAGTLERHAARLGFDFSVGPGAAHALEPASDALEGLRLAAHYAIATAESAQSALDFAELRRMHEDALLTAAVRAILPATERRDEALASHERAVRLAVEALEARADETLYLADLCGAAGVSERTLRNAFQRIFGVSPIRFLQQHRMNGIRRLLLEADPSQDRVSAIAQRFGFTNLGRFAVEFRQLYGVSPSALLRR